MTYRVSGWTYNTGSSINTSIGPLSFARGMLVVNDPSGCGRRFNFSTFVAGLWSRKLVPKTLELPQIPFPKGQGSSGSGASTDFDSGGFVLMNNTFHGRDLSIEDFSGGAFCADLSGGFLVAMGFTAMAVGVPLPIMLASTAFPQFSNLAMNSAKALIIMKGVSEGLLDSIGLSAGVGQLSYAGDYAID